MNHPFLQVHSLGNTLLPDMSFFNFFVFSHFRTCSFSLQLVTWNILLVKMSGVERKRNVLNVKQKLEILQQLDKRESVSTDAEDVLNEGNTISDSAALQSVETFLDYMGERGFDYGDITAVRNRCVDIRQEMNKQQKQRRITDFLKH
ncbi:hypothetical protein AVEN_65935-1 [Araneus ventricosus]|uniref:Uncharacterized protein n=1 Tax=Araneus ventricosus TaxID=182803 RepID=A0A4Y2U1C3_ARAVE|nr:hypothetical protein AVEN_65935-1 [Araneus ventricosus]